MNRFLFFVCLILSSCTMYVPDRFEEKSSLQDFLTKNLSTKNIEEIKDDSIKSSSRTDSARKMVYDTLKGKNLMIIVQTCYGSNESQVISINGKIAGNYRKGKGDEEDLFSISGKEIRHFKFKGKEFYYLPARSMKTTGGSAALISYQLFYDVRNNSLAEFSNFRVEDVRLYGDVNGDNQLDFLQIENEGGYGIDSINNFTMKIASCNEKGIFSMLKDSIGKEYSIEGNSGKDYYIGQNFNIEKYYWPVKLK